MRSLFSGTLDWGDWFRGLMAGFIGGGAGSFGGGLTTMIVDPDHFNFAHPAKVLEAMAGMFLVNGLLTAMAYLHQNPVPGIVTTTTTESVKRSPTGAVTATKTEETKVEPAPTPDAATK